MKLDEYAMKEMKRVNDLPWIQSNENVDMTEEELWQSIQKYYLLNNLILKHTHNE